MAPGPRRRTHSTILHRLNSILKRNPSLFHHLCLVRKSTILGHGLGHTMLTQTLRTLTTNVRCGCTQFAFQDSGLFGFNPWPPSPPPPPSLLLPLPLLLLLLLLLPLSGPSRCHLMAHAAHGSSLIGHTSANNVLTVRTYCHMAGGENITREPKPKSVSKHFVLH